MSKVSSTPTKANSTIASAIHSPTATGSNNLPSSNPASPAPCGRVGSPSPHNSKSVSSPIGPADGQQAGGLTLQGRGRSSSTTPIASVTVTSPMDIPIIDTGSVFGPGTSNSTTSTKGNNTNNNNNNSTSMKRSNSSNSLNPHKGVNMALAKLIRHEDLPPERPTVVLKIGSSSVMSADGRHPNLSKLSRFAEIVCEMVRNNYSVIIVSSGAVSIGCQRLGLTERPKSVITKQAVAAVGQGRLMRLYDDLFSIMSQPIAQVLLSRENIAQEHHYRNALNTLKELLRLGIVPIVNENDTVAVDELRFGDNDTLSALVASIVRAHWLFLLTDVDALYTANPRTDASARPIHVVEDVADLNVDTGDGGISGRWGTGGMATKIQAATIATAAGVRTAICSTEHLDHIKQMLEGSTSVGTQFTPKSRAITGHKKWIAQGLRPQGTLVIDEGAQRAVFEKRSLFAAGIVNVLGDFPPHSGVRLVNASGRELGRGLTNYSSTEIMLIRGLKSNQIPERLGYHGPDVVIHRGNLVALGTLSPTNSSSNLAALVNSNNSNNVSSCASTSAAAGAGERGSPAGTSAEAKSSGDVLVDASSSSTSSSAASAASATAVNGDGGEGVEMKHDRRNHPRSSSDAFTSSASSRGSLSPSPSPSPHLPVDLDVTAETVARTVVGNSSSRVHVASSHFNSRSHLFAEGDGDGDFASCSSAGAAEDRDSSVASAENGNRTDSVAAEEEDCLSPEPVDMVI